MRFLAVPAVILILTWIILWFWKEWSHVPTWKKIGTIAVCSLGALLLSAGIIFLIVIVFN